MIGNKLSNVFLLAVGLCILFTANVSGAVPETVYFQSYLTDDTGARVDDGNYLITVSLWDADSESGNKLWEESHNAMVSGGLYSISLGSVTPFSDPNKDNNKNDALSFAVPYYLGIKTGTGAYLKVDGKFPMLASVTSSLRAKTSAGRLLSLKNSDYQITTNDDIILVSGASKITLPSAVGLGGRVFTIKKADPGGSAVSIVTTAGQTVEGINRDISSGGTAYEMTDQYSEITVFSDGSNWMKTGGATSSSANFTDLSTKGNVTLGDEASDTVKVSGSLQVGSAFYLGEPGAAGTWRVVQVGSDLVFQCADDTPGNWVDKLSIKK